MYNSYIDVIGDKMGGSGIPCVVYFIDPTKFEHHLNKLHGITPFKVFHVIKQKQPGHVKKVH